MKKTSPEPTSLAPHLSLLAVQMMFGSLPALGKIALQTFPPLAIVGFRVAGAAVFFVALQSFKRDIWLERRADYAWFALYAVLGIALNQTLFVTGLSLTTAVNASILAVTIPVFAFAVGSLANVEKPSWQKLGGILLAAFGVIYLIDPTRASFSANTTLGDLLVVANSVFYGTYIAISKKLIGQYGALKSTAWLFMFASCISVPLGAYSLGSVDLSNVSISVWLAVGYIVVFGTIAAYFLNAWSLARVSPTTVAVYIYLQPIIGFFLAVLFLGEHLTFRGAFAIALIFAGVFLVTRNGKTPEAVLHQT